MLCAFPGAAISRWSQSQVSVIDRGDREALVLRFCVDAN
jgi:hypothetical protein